MREALADGVHAADKGGADGSEAHEEDSKWARRRFDIHCGMSHQRAPKMGSSSESRHFAANGGSRVFGLQIKISWPGRAVTTNPAERAIASTQAEFGAHQFVGSFSSECSMNAIFG